MRTLASFTGRGGETSVSAEHALTAFFLLVLLTLLSCAVHEPAVTDGLIALTVPAAYFCLRQVDGA